MVDRRCSKMGQHKRVSGHMCWFLVCVLGVDFGPLRPAAQLSQQLHKLSAHAVLGAGRSGGGVVETAGNLKPRQMAPCAVCRPYVGPSSDPCWLPLLIYGSCCKAQGCRGGHTQGGADPSLLQMCAGLYWCNRDVDSTRMCPALHVLSSIDFSSSRFADALSFIQS
jgi:hypothetical protein